MPKHFGLLPVGSRLIESLSRRMKQAVWIAAALFSFNAYALDSDGGGCTEQDGRVTCSGGDYVVIGEPTDSFGCRKNPQNCLPTNPPRQPGASSTGTSTDGTRPGREIKDAETLNAAVLRNMDCAELSAQEALYKAYVETDKALRDAHQASLKEADDMIKSAAYSETEMNYLLDLKNMACSTYDATKQQRLNGPKECFDRPTGKPQICRTPTATRAEIEQSQRCLNATRDSNARAGDLAAWKERKATAETRVQTMSANLRHDSQMLQKIAAEKKRKKCTS